MRTWQSSLCRAVFFFCETRILLICRPSSPSEMSLPVIQQQNEPIVEEMTDTPQGTQLARIPAAANCLQNVPRYAMAVVRGLQNQKAFSRCSNCDIPLVTDQQKANGLCPDCKRKRDGAEGTFAQKRTLAEFLGKQGLPTAEDGKLINKKHRYTKALFNQLKTLYKQHQNLRAKGAATEEMEKLIVAMLAQLRANQ